MRFQVPEGCGTEAGFRRELESLVGGAAPDVEPSVLEIAPQDEGGFKLHLEVTGEVREIVDSDCRTLLRSAVVIVAAAARGKEPPPPAPSEPAPTAPTVAAEPLPAPPPPPPERREKREVVVRVVEPPPPLESVDAPPAASVARPLTFALGAGIGLSGGTVPGASAVLDLRAGLDPAPVGFAVSARYWPGNAAERDGRSVHVTGLGGRAAALIELGSVLHTSLGLEVDRLAGTGQEGVSGRASDTVWLIAGALELNVIPWSVEDIRLELGLGAQLALLRPRFVVGGFGNLYEVPHLGGGAIIRAVWLFR